MGSKIKRKMIQLLESEHKKPRPSGFETPIPQFPLIPVPSGTLYIPPIPYTKLNIIKV